MTIRDLLVKIPKTTDTDKKYNIYVAIYRQCARAWEMQSDTMNAAIVKYGAEDEKTIAKFDRYVSGTKFENAARLEFLTKIQAGDTATINFVKVQMQIQDRNAAREIAEQERQKEINATLHMHYYPLAEMPA